MAYNIFTFDKLSEQKSKVFTMVIFSVCLLLFPALIIIFDWGIVSLATHFLQDASVPIYGGLEQKYLSYVMGLIYGLLAVSIPMVLCFAIAALKQLLICYVELENGNLVKLRWQPRPSGHAQAFVFTNKILEPVLNIDRAYAHRTMTKAKGVFDAISNIQNPQLIADYLNGQFAGHQIEAYPLANIQLVKQTKKKIVILADTIIKGKPTRKRIKIYCIYHNMDRLISICAGGITR